VNNLLQLKHIYKVFNEGSLDEKVALNGINLEVKKGDFITVIGSNGAGKSTLLNIIAGKLFPDDGEVLLDEKNMTNLPEYKRAKYIGRVFQNPLAGTAPSLTIEENLAIAYGRVHKRTLGRGVTSKRRQQFKEQLALLGLGLENRLNAKVGLLSGGERQALSLLMATFTKPKILLLDEHTAALDPARAEVILSLTKKFIHEYQLTTIMITHNMQQAIDLGNRLIMMNRGEIIFEASEETKKELTIPRLMKEFEKIQETVSDRVILG
jgi:putative ABC transport system ATP-binding protein